MRVCEQEACTSSIGGAGAALKPLCSRDVAWSRTDDVRDMGVPPEPRDTGRIDRALDRLAEHCDAIGRMTAALEERRPQVRQLKASSGGAHPDAARGAGRARLTRPSVR
jgi:hypothetical protein